MAIEWSKLEKLLVEHAERALADFMKEHASETFYGAMFAVEAYDGVFVHLMLGSQDKLEAGADRFLLANFEYTIRLNKLIEGWSQFDDAIVEATETDMDEERTDPDGRWLTSSKLLETTGAAAMKLEATLGKLKRTPNFFVGVSADQYEPGDMSVERYEKLKKTRRLSVPVGR